MPNYYSPYSFQTGYQNPYQQAYQPQSIQQAPQMFQQTQNQTAESGVYWCHGQSEAERWAVAPGHAVAIMDIDAPVLYLRSCDTTGKPSTAVYDLVERTPAARMQQNAQNAAKMQQDFLTRAEFEQFKADFLKNMSKEEPNDA